VVLYSQEGGKEWGGEGIVKVGKRGYEIISREMGRGVGGPGKMGCQGKKLLGRGKEGFEIISAGWKKERNFNSDLVQKKNRRVFS